MLSCSCPYAAAWVDGILCCCGVFFVVVEDMKYVMDAGSGVMTSMPLCRSLYSVDAVC